MRRKSREKVRESDDGEIPNTDEGDSGEEEGGGGGDVRGKGVKNEKPLCWNVHHGNDSCLFMTHWRPTEPSNGTAPKGSGHAQCGHRRRKS